MHYWRAMLAGALLIGLADGQITQVDLRTQSRDVDFSGANTTKPFKAGTALPATCAVGEAFFQTNAAAGMNLYGCTAVNSWTLLSGGGFNPALIPTHDTIHADENYQASSNGTTAMTTVSPDKALTGYTAGQCFDFVTDTSNPVSINIDGLGAKTLTMGDGATALPAGAAQASYPFTACYDGTVFRLKSSSALMAAPERYDVKAAPYGAKGDGVTDDTAAIQSAINAAYNAGGGTVYLPCGNYALASPTDLGFYYFLWLKNNVTLQGENKACVTLLPTNYQGQTAVVTVTSGGPHFYQNAFQMVQDINNNTYYPIGATSQGNNTITLTTAAQASNFAAGNYVAIYYVAAQTTLSGSLSSVSPGATGTMTLASATGFPTAYPFYVLTDYNEEIEVTSLVSGTTYNIERGVNGSVSPTPAHSSGAAIQLVFTGDGVGPGETGTVLASNSSTGVITLKNPMARSFSNAIIANVTNAAGYNITVSDLTLYCQVCFITNNTFGFSVERVRAITDGSGPANGNRHFEMNTNRGVLFKDSEMLATTSNLPAIDDPAADDSQDITFDNVTQVSASFGSAEYPAHFTITNSRFWLEPLSSTAVGFSLTGYDMKATGNTIWIAPTSTASLIGVTDSDGLTNSNYQWFGNVVFTDNDISASDSSSGTSGVYLASTGAVLSGGHINVNGSAMRAIEIQDFVGQLPSVTVDHVGILGCASTNCVNDNQIYSGYDGLTFTNNTVGGSSTNAITLSNPSAPNAGHGRILGNGSLAGSTFSTFLNWTAANHPGILTDDGRAGTLVDLASTQSLTNKTLDGVSPTTLGYLDATSSVQTQLNAKQSSSSPNVNNAGIGNCTSGQYGTGTAAGTTQPCAQVQYSQLGGTTPTWNQNTTGTARYVAPTVLTVATLPSSPITNEVVPISDGAAASDCTAGGGSQAHSCQWNGTAWVADYTQSWEVMIPSDTSAVGASTTDYYSPGYVGAANSTLNSRNVVMSSPCHMTNFYNNVISAQSTSSTVLTIMKNASTTALAVTITASATIGTVFSDTTHSVDFAPGDLFAIQIANGSGATSGLYAGSVMCQK